MSNPVRNYAVRGLGNQSVTVFFTDEVPVFRECQTCEVGVVTVDVGEHKCNVCKQTCNSGVTTWTYTCDCVDGRYPTPINIVNYHPTVSYEMFLFLRGIEIGPGEHCKL